MEAAAVVSSVVHLPRRFQREGKLVFVGISFGETTGDQVKVEETKIHRPLQQLPRLF